MMNDISRCLKATKRREATLTFESNLTGFSSSCSTQMRRNSGQSYKTFYTRKLRIWSRNIGNFIDSTMAIYEHKMFIRLVTDLTQLTRNL